MPSVTVSGSFHRHMTAIERAVFEFKGLGLHVLSPANPIVVDHVGEFLFVASDRVRSVRLVQDRHLDCIQASDFLWLVCPDGYVGQSASMEVGFAVANDVPVLSTHSPADLTLKQYVQTCEGLEVASRRFSKGRTSKPESFLIDPHASIETAHQVLDRIHSALNSSRTQDIGQAVSADRRSLVKLVGPPL